MRLRTLVLVTVASATACGGSTEPEADRFPDAPYEVVTCSAMEPARLSAAPTEHVSLGELPASFEAPFLARVETDDPAVYGYAAVAVDESGQATLVAPLHPSASPDGGTATIWVSDGTRSCEPFDFTVQALTPSPGELTKVADHLQAIVDAQAAALGATRADLVQTSLVDQPSALLPIAVLQAFLDHPDNENSLVAIADGTAPVAADARLDLLEPLLAMTGIEAALADIAPAGAASAPRRAGPARVSAAQCEPGTIGDDAGLLDACMDAAWEAQFELAGASGQVLRDMGEFFTAAGLVPGLETPAAIAGFITWMATNDKLRTAALLPSALTEMTVEVGPVEFLEDEDGSGSWSSAQVKATNLGWDFGKEFLEGLLAAASAAGAFDKTELPGEVNGVLLTLATGPGVQELIGDGTLESFQEEPKTFGPVNVTSETWSTAEVATGDAIELVSHTDYEPRNAGSSVLSVRTKDGEFGGQQISAQKTITVGTLQVTISPDDVLVPADSSKEFTVTVVHAAHPDMVAIDPSVPLQGDAQITYNGNGTHTVSYTAPSAPDVNDPDLLTVLDTARTGARGYASTERLDIATIRFGGVRITDVPPCIEPGSAPVQIGVDVAIQGDPQLTWTASAGSITDSGSFTPPDQAGYVTITVALVDNPDVNDSVEVQVGGCSCRANLVVNGQSPSALFLRFFLTPDLGAVTGFDWRPDGVGQVTFGFGDPLNPTPVAVNTTGSFQGSVNGLVNTMTFANPDDLQDPTIPPLTISLSENTGSILEGHVSGLVSVAADPDPINAQLTMDFHIEADPALSRTDAKMCEVQLP